MAETVRELDLGVEWSPNVPNTVVRYGDWGDTTLELAAHEADPDQRRVVLTWQRCLGLLVGAHNDEVLHLHRLYEAGLADVHWAGEVIDSSWIAATVPVVYDASGLRHYIFPLKECTIEVLAEGVEVTRPGGLAK